MNVYVSRGKKIIAKNGTQHWDFASQKNPGSLDADSLTDFILSKVAKRTVKTKSANLCAGYMLAHNGSTTGGGCPSAVKYKGKTVFHHSTGQKGKSDGCTIFFANSGDGTAVLLAVGYHDKDVKGEPHYSLDWTHRSWYQGGSIQF